MRAQSGKKNVHANSRRIDRTSFVLADDKIVMRPFGRKELYSDEYLSWMNDSEVTKTIGRYDYLMPVTRKKLIDYVSHIDPTNTIFLAVYVSGKKQQMDAQRGTFIGTLKIYDIDMLARRASLGILIGEKSEWGKGYAQRAIRIACQYIFDVLGLQKVAAGYVSSNPGMARAFMKNGFVQEGVLKEHVFCCGKLVDHILVGKFRGDS